MATILGRAAVCQLTNLVLSEIISPTSPVSKMIEILKHMLYKSLYLNLVLTTKKKAAEFPQGIQMTGLGWEKGLGMGESILEIISEWESI